MMNKFLALGLSVDEVILRSTWNPAREIGQEQLGNLSVGSPGGRRRAAARTGRIRLPRFLWRPAARQPRS